MSHFYNAQFRGNVSEPEIKEVGSNTVQEFTVFAQNQRKNKDSGEYEEQSPNEPVRVSLWNDAIVDELGKGDLVAVTASLSLRKFERQDGSEGYALQTEYIEDFEIKISKAARGSGARKETAKVGF
jgi:single-stranded DNA-binding protein